MTATGLSLNSPLPTSQSSAFFSAPGTPCAYSGLEMITASHRSMAHRSAWTAGVISLSRTSGLNAGIGKRPSNVVTSTPLGASCVAAAMTERFVERRLTLPEMPRIRTRRVSSMS